MTRHDWDELPSAVCTAIEAQCGTVTAVVVPDAGRNSDLSVTLHTGDGQVVFCKGVDLATRRAWMHRHEARVAPYLPRVAPRLLWQSETGGWLLLGFEHVAGHHAALAPGSPDLPMVAATMGTLGSELTACPLPDVPRLSEQWVRLAAWRRLWHDTSIELTPWTREHLRDFIDWEYRAFELIDGDTLAHTDLHPLNLLVGEQARVIDWAWSRRAAPWVDVAFLIIRLMADGHTPEAAEQWAETVPVWHEATTEAHTAFAVAVLGIWEYMQRADPAAYRSRLVRVARDWVSYRLQKSLMRT